MATTTRTMGQQQQQRLQQRNLPAVPVDDDAEVEENLASAATTASLVVTPGDDDVSSSPQQQLHPLSLSSVIAALRAYVHSPDFYELSGWVAFALVTCVPVFLADSRPRERPIPYQALYPDPLPNATNSSATPEAALYVRNLNYDTEFTTETVSNAVLGVVGQVVPFVLQFAMSWRWGRLGDCHRTLCAYLVSFAISASTTGVIKLYVGYLRPYFYQACQPNDTYQECTSSDTDSTLEVRKSFLSGHASLSFGGLMLLTLYVHNRFGIPSVVAEYYERIEHALGGDGSSTRFRIVPVVDDVLTNGKRRRDALRRLVSVLALLPLAVATFVAASRIVDNKHHPADVVAGAVLGGSVSVYVNGLWFR